MSYNDYLELKSISHNIFVENEKIRRKSFLKNINRDFYADLPNQLCQILDDFCWQYKEQKWFEEAWDKYRKHVLDAGLGGKIKMPGFIFNEYVDKYVDDEQKRMKNELVQSDSNIEELYHHGIKGQKWGVRKFQNKDGTLTDAGKARYDESGNLKNDPRLMNDKDLKATNARLEAESKYQQLTGTTQPGKSLTRDNAIKIGSTFVATAAATFLIRKYKNGVWVGEPGQAITDENKKKVIGEAISTAALAGGIGSLIAATQSLGGSANPPGK